MTRWRAARDAPDEAGHPLTPDGAAAGDGTVTPKSSRRTSRRAQALRLVRILVVLAVLGFLVLALARRWTDVREQLAQVDAAAIGGSFALVVTAGAASMMAWRALLADLGSPLPARAAARVLFVGQLAKYLPGSSVWAVLAQTHLAGDYGVPRRRAGSVAVVFNVVSLGIALLVSLLALPRLVSADAPTWVRYAPLVVPLGVLCLLPPVLSRLIDVLLRVLRRAPLDARFGWSGVGRACAWLLVTWILYGLHVVVLATDLGGSARELLLPSIGAFAAAWAAGFLVMVVPTGVGTREVVLTVALAGLLPGGEAAAIAIAVVSRLLFTVSDIALGGGAALLRPSRADLDRRRDA